MKKISLLAAAIMLLSLFANSQNLGINADGSKPDKNAILDVKSTTKGILIPRMSSAQRLAIPATKGMLVYDLTTNSFWYNNGAEWKTMSGSSALASTGPWEVTGNAGTDPNNFLGTTDAVNLFIRVNNIHSGRIDQFQQSTFWGYGSGAQDGGGKNTGIGFEALANCTGGFNNTAVGRFSLRNNTSGHANTAIGMDALGANTIGARNTALGTLALLSNTEGHENTAIGFDALRSNNSTGGNTATGTNSLRNNQNGINNTATGANSLWTGNTGSDNTATGHSALSLSSGNYNTANGAFCMWFAGDGNYNTAMGHFTMLYNQGNYNTGIGAGVLHGNTHGYYLTALGAGSGVEHDNLFNSTAIGAGAIVDASNKVRIGNSAVTVIEGQVPFTTPSDGRFKFNVNEDVKGVDFIMQLWPVTYQFDVKRFDGKSGENAAMQAAYTEAENIRRTGFIAQEVEKAAINTGYNFSGVIKPKKEGDHYSLSYDAFVVPLVKAVQEQQQVINDQNKKIADLQQQLDEIKKLLQQKK